MREIKFKFVVKDNNGNIHLTQTYTYDENGLPNYEKILEDMEKCNCTLTESVNCCEGDCINFDNGEVLYKLQYVNKKDCEGTEIYEGYIVEYENNNCGYGRPREEELSRYIVPDIIDIDSDYKLLVFNDSCKVLGNIYKNPELNI